MTVRDEDLMAFVDDELPEAEAAEVAAAIAADPALAARAEAFRRSRALVAEARLRPLTNPMKMNGCAMVVLNPPAGAEAAAQEICNWVCDTLGDTGARAEVWSS